jgi:hypothetical protein
MPGTTLAWRCYWSPEQIGALFIGVVVVFVFVVAVGEF